MPPPWPASEPTPAHRAAYAGAVPRSFWLDTLPERAPHPPLEESIDADLCIVGGGYTGLWAALYAKSLEPGREVVVLEATRCGNGASGRNGGFVEPSLTHGTRNGLAHFPDELDRLERLGRENLAALAQDLVDLGIDAEFERGGDLVVALEPREAADLAEEAELLRRFGYDTELLDGDETRKHLDSPLFLGSLWTRTGGGLVNPGKLADGLRAAAVRAGVRIHEHSPVRTLRGRVSAITDGGVVNARSVLLATSAYPPLLPAIRRHIAPVYDYVLVSEPVDLSLIGWAQRQGVSDMGNQFHYYRLTADDRILWGGYDAVYRYGGPVGPHLDDHEPTFAKLSQHFFTAFPQLEGVRSRRRRRRRRQIPMTIGGAARSTPAVGSRCSSAGRSRGAWPTRSATPGWAWRPAGSAPASPSTCSTDAVTRPPSSPWSAAPRFPSHPSRCAARSSSSRAIGWPPPTATTAAVASG